MPTRVNRRHFESVGCPHCEGGRIRECCVCHDVGRLFLREPLIASMRNAWARPGCACLACRIAGPGPKRDLDAN